jgi:hypothetical protein
LTGNDVCVQVQERHHHEMARHVSRGSLLHSGTRHIVGRRTLLISLILDPLHCWGTELRPGLTGYDLLDQDSYSE